MYIFIAEIKRKTVKLPNFSKKYDVKELFQINDKNITNFLKNT